MTVPRALETSWSIAQPSPASGSSARRAPSSSAERPNFRLPAAASAGLLRDRFDLLARPPRDGDLHARGGELARDVRANPAPAAGYERCLGTEFALVHRADTLRQRVRGCYLVGTGRQSRC